MFNIAMNKLSIVFLVRLTIIVVLVAAGFIAFRTADSSWQTYQGLGPSLPEAGLPVSPDARASHPFLTTALQYQELPYEKKVITIEYDDSTFQTRSLTPETQVNLAISQTAKYN